MGQMEGLQVLSYTHEHYDRPYAFGTRPANSSSCVYGYKHLVRRKEGRTCLLRILGDEKLHTSRIRSPIGPTLGSPKLGPVRYTRPTSGVTTYGSSSLGALGVEGRRRGTAGRPPPVPRAVSFAL